jgi:protein gp37
MLGPINLLKPLFEDSPFTMLDPIEWVICGGESGEGFRRMEPAWAMNLFAQCQQEKVAFFMKQASSLYNESKGDLPGGLWDVKEFPR